MKTRKQILIMSFILMLILFSINCSESSSIVDANGIAETDSLNSILNTNDLGLSQTESSQSGATANLKVLFWNINAARNSDISTIANYIKSVDADVIGLNEVYIDQISTIMDTLGAGYQRTFHNLKTNSDFGNLTISKNSIEGSATQRWTYSQNSTDGCEGTGDNGNRQGLMKTKIDIGSGKFLFLYNTHFGRECQTMVQDAQIAECKTWSNSHGGRKILVGDFNLQPHSAQHTLLTTGGPAFIDPLGSAFNFKTWKVGSSSLNKRIDYIMGNGWVTINSITTGTSMDSDHYPVIADVSITL